MNFQDTKDHGCGVLIGTVLLSFVHPLLGVLFFVVMMLGWTAIRIDGWIKARKQEKANERIIERDDEWNW